MPTDCNLISTHCNVIIHKLGHKMAAEMTAKTQHLDGSMMSCSIFASAIGQEYHPILEGEVQCINVSSTVFEL